MIKKANSYNLAGPHYLWSKNKSAIKTELKGLSHWADKVTWVQKPEEVGDRALAFVSTKDWDGNGRPDNIYIITNKIQSKDDMTFVAEVADAIRHEVDHIEKGRRIEGVDGAPATYEFSPEYSAESAEVGMEQQLKEMAAAASVNLEIAKDLIKMSSRLDDAGLFKEADKIDLVVKRYLL